MDAMKRTTGYAESQIRLLLSDLRSGSHSAKEKALKRFKDYVNTYKPNVCDDDAELLLAGAKQGSNRINGLMHFCGLDSSEKHKGGLKRITKDCIQLLKWLLSVKLTDDTEEVDEDEEQVNIFYFIFVHLEKEAYRSLNFTKHVQNHDSKDDERGGSLQDACEIIQILLADHRKYGDEEDESDPLEIEDILEGNQGCIDIYKVWDKKAKADHITKTIEQFNKAKAKAAAKVLRPHNWEDVIFAPVPKQEGEEGAVAEKVDNEEEKIIADPLGLIDVDLRTTQQLYQSGKIAPAKGDGGYSSAVSFNKRIDRLKGKVAVPDDSDESSNASSSSDDDSWAEVSPSAETTRGRGGGGSRFSLHDNSPASPTRDRRTSNVVGLRGRSSTVAMSPTKATKPTKDSVLPKDKNFSAGLFLSLVHAVTSWDDLTHGLKNLEKILGVHGSQRESLVRSHYGLFVQCAQGLDWLKGFRKNIDKSYEASFEETKGTAHVGRRSIGAATLTEKSADVTINRAIQSLNAAKLNANMTLEPILKGMKSMARLKNTTKIIKKFESTLDLPIKMKRAWDRNELSDFFVHFNKIMTLPSASSTNTSSGGPGGFQGQAQNVVLASGSSLRLFQKVRALADVIISNIRQQSLSVLTYPCFDVTKDNLRDGFKAFSDSESDSESDSDSDSDDDNIKAATGKKENIDNAKAKDDATSPKTSIEPIDVNNYYVSGYERILPYYKLLLAVDAKVNLDEPVYSPAVSAVIQRLFNVQCYYFVSVIKSLVIDLMDDLQTAFINGTVRNERVVSDLKAKRASQAANNSIITDMSGGPGESAKSSGGRRKSTFGLKRRVSFIGDMGGLGGGDSETKDGNDRINEINDITGGDDEFSYDASSAVFDDCLDDLFLPDYYYSNGPEIWSLDLLSPQEKKTQSIHTLTQHVRTSQGTPNVDYASLLTQRIRIIYCLKFCRALLQWLPVLNRLSQDFQTAVDKQFTQTSNNLLSSALRQAAAPQNLASNAAILQSPTRILPQIVSLVGEITAQCIQGMKEIPDQKGSSSQPISSFINKNRKPSGRNRSSSFGTDASGDSFSYNKESDLRRSLFDICDQLSALVTTPEVLMQIKGVLGEEGIPIPKPTSSAPDSPRKRSAQIQSHSVDEDYGALLKLPYIQQPLEDNNYNSLIFDISRTYEAIEELLLTKYDDLLVGKSTSTAVIKSGGASALNDNIRNNNNNNNNNNKTMSQSGKQSATGGASASSAGGSPDNKPERKMFGAIVGSKSTTSSGATKAPIASSGATNKNSKIGGSLAFDATDNVSDLLLKLDTRKRLQKGSHFYDYMVSWRNISIESDEQIAQRLSSLFLSITRYLPSQSEFQLEFGDQEMPQGDSDGFDRERRYILDLDSLQAQIGASVVRGFTRKNWRSSLGSFELVTSSYYFWCLLFLQKVSASVANSSAVSSYVSSTIKSSFLLFTQSLESDFTKLSSGNSPNSAQLSKSTKDLLKKRQSLDNNLIGSSVEEVDLFALDVSMSSFQSSLFEQCSDSSGGILSHSGVGSDPISQKYGSSNSSSIQDSKSSKSQRGGAVSSAATNSKGKTVGSSSTALLSFYYDLLRSAILIRSHVIPFVSTHLLFKFPITTSGGEKEKTQQFSGHDDFDAPMPKDGSNGTAKKDVSFFDKIFSGTKKAEATSGGNTVTGDDKDVHSSHLTTYSKLLVSYQTDEEVWSLSGTCYEDVLKFEEGIFGAIISNFSTHIRNLLFTSYSNSLKRLYTFTLESSFSSQSSIESRKHLLSPVHLSQILIVIGEERARLAKTFQNCNFTSGVIDHFVSLVNAFVAEGENQHHIHGAPIEDDDLDFDEQNDDDFEHYFSFKSNPEGTSSSDNDKYCDVLFKGMCYAALDIYGQLLNEIRTGGLASSLKDACSVLTGTSIDGSKDAAIFSLLFAQAFEELECLKMIVRQVFPTLAFHVAPLEPQNKTAQTTGFNYSSVPYARRDTLLKLVLNLAIKIVR